jgi:hypothetical protein
MKITKNLITFSLLFMMLSGCFKTYYYYIPNKQSVLDFKEKGDANFSYSIGTQKTESLTLGYSLSKNIALNTQLHTMDESDGRNRKNETVVFNNEIILYKKFMNFYPALNIGYGTGKLYKYVEDFDLRMRTMYLQPSIGYSNDYFDIGFSCKISNNYFHLQMYNPKPTENYNFQDVGSREFHFYEPAFTFGVGYKNIKIRFQSINTHQFNSSIMNYYKSNLYLSLNINLNINQLLNKKK